MVEDMWVEGRVQMETYQLMRLMGEPNQYSLVVSVDWSGWCCVCVPRRLLRC